MRPGLVIDIIPRWSPLTVAVIASQVGQPCDLRASWIDPSSLRFGSRAQLIAGGFVFVREPDGGPAE